VDHICGAFQIEQVMNFLEALAGSSCHALRRGNCDNKKTVYSHTAQQNEETWLLRFNQSCDKTRVNFIEKLAQRAQPSSASACR
jgi:hypothetical protein